MPAVDPIFNPELDKVTERETVFDFVSRLPIGLNFTSIEAGKEDMVIFKPPRKLKDIIRKDVMALPKTIAYNLDNVLTTFVIINVDGKTKEIVAPIPAGTDPAQTLLLAYSERLQQDLSSLFVKEGTSFKMTIDVPYQNCFESTNTKSFYKDGVCDIIKFYWLSQYDHREPPSPTAEKPTASIQ